MADNRFAKWLGAHIVAWWAWLAVGSIVLAGMQVVFLLHGDGDQRAEIFALVCFAIAGISNTTVAVSIARQRRRGAPPAP